jgi:hypothetical protein
MMPVIPADKANHFVYGAVVGFAVTALAIMLNLPYLLAYSIAASALIGVAKEVYDKVSKKGHASVADAVATALGGLPITIILGMLS